MAETVLFSIFVGLMGIIAAIIVWLLFQLKKEDPKSKKTKKLGNGN